MNDSSRYCSMKKIVNGGLWLPRWPDHTAELSIAEAEEFENHSRLQCHKISTRILTCIFMGETKQFAE